MTNIELLFSLPVLTQVPETFLGAATRKTCSLDSLKHSFWENKTNLNMVSLSSPNISVQNLAQIPQCVHNICTKTWHNCQCAANACAVFQRKASVHPTLSLNFCTIGTVCRLVCEGVDFPVWW